MEGWLPILPPTLSKITQESTEICWFFYIKYHYKFVDAKVIVYVQNISSYFNQRGVLVWLLLQGPRDDR